jgi:hypothetical protein
MIVLIVVSDSSNVSVRTMFCSGSHGLSIAGGGTGVGHDISNILFVSENESFHFISSAN